MLNNIKGLENLQDTILKQKQEATMKTHSLTEIIEYLQDLQNKLKAEATNGLNLQLFGDAPAADEPIRIEHSTIDRGAYRDVITVHVSQRR